MNRQSLDNYITGHYGEDQTEESMVTISLPGTVILARSWDDSGRFTNYTGDKSLDDELNQAFSDAQTVKRGKGYSLVLTLSESAAWVIVRDLEDVGEVYSHDAEDIRAWGRAMLKTAAKIRKQLTGEDYPLR